MKIQVCRFTFSYSETCTIRGGIIGYSGLSSNDKWLQVEINASLNTQ